MRSLIRGLWAGSTAEPRRVAGPVMMVTLLSVDPGAFPEILDKINRRFGARRRIIFLVSTYDVSAFLERRAEFEFFMPIGEQIAHRDLMDWPDYLAEKWKLMLAKWRPRTIVAYGSNVDRFLAEARAARLAALHG